MTSQETIASAGIKRDGEHRDTWYLDACLASVSSTVSDEVANRWIEWISFEPSDGAVVLYSAGATHIVWHFAAQVSVLQDDLPDGKRSLSPPVAQDGGAGVGRNGHLDDFHLDAELNVTFTELSARRFDEQQHQQQQPSSAGASVMESKGTLSKPSAAGVKKAAAAATASTEQLTTPLKVIRQDRARNVLDPGTRSIDVWWCMELPQQWVQHNEKVSFQQGPVELVSQGQALSWHTVLFPRRRLHLYTNNRRRLRLRIVSNEFSLSDRAYQNPLRRRPLLLTSSSSSIPHELGVGASASNDSRHRSIWTHFAQRTVLIVPVASDQTAPSGRQKQDIELWRMTLTKRLGIPKKQVSVCLVNEQDSERQQWLHILEQLDRSAGGKGGGLDDDHLHAGRGVCLIRATQAVPHPLFTLSAWEAELWLLWATLSGMREQSLGEQTIVCLSGNNLTEQQQLLDLKQPSSRQVSARSTSPPTTTASRAILTPQDRRHPMQLTSLVTFLPRPQMESFQRIPVQTSLTVAQWLDRQGDKVMRSTMDLVILKPQQQQHQP